MSINVTVYRKEVNVIISNYICTKEFYEELQNYITTKYKGNIFDVMGIKLDVQKKICEGIRKGEIACKRV